MFGHSWQKAEDTIVRVHNKRTTGDDGRRVHRGTPTHHRVSLMTLHRVLRSAAPAIALMTLASACGSSPRTSTVASTPAPTATSPATTAPGAAATIATSTTINTTTEAIVTTRPTDTTVDKGGVAIYATGKLPADFPADFPLPGLLLETATGSGGNYTLRYASVDANGDVMAYQKVMEKAGYMLTGEVDSLDGQSHGFAVTARTNVFHIEATGYNAEASGGGNYMEIIIEKS